jgi:DNA-binding response OmpR family regulator
MARNVLLVDYDPRSVGQLRTALHGVGLEVRVARDGVDGVAQFFARHPDLMLIQDLLPKKHGLEVCRDLKRTDVGKRTPIIVIVAAARAGRCEILDSDCDGYVTKPLDERILLERVREHLELEERELRAINNNSEVHVTGTVASRQATPPERCPQTVNVEFEEGDIDSALDVLSLDCGSTGHSHDAPSDVPKKKTRSGNRVKRATKPPAAAPAAGNKGRKRSKSTRCAGTSKSTKRKTGKGRRSTKKGKTRRAASPVRS